MGRLLVVWVLVAAVAGCDAAKVLVLHPMYAASHVLTLRALAKGLVARGHEVVVVRWKDTHQYPDADDAGITEHVLAINNSRGDVPHLTTQHAASFIMPQELMWNKGTSFAAIPLDAFFTVAAFCRSLLERQDLIEVLRKEDFDVAIVDLIYNECSLALAHDLGLPVVGYWAFTPSGGEIQYTSAFSPPSTVPIIMSHCPEDMSFTQRLWNHVMALGSHAVMQTQFLLCDSIIRGFLPSFPGSRHALANLSGLLINSHPAVDTPRLLPPSFIYAGGMQVRRDARPLPQDLEEWMAGAEHGVVLFALGFIFNSEVVPPEVLKALMDAFGKLDQRVIMKLEGPYDYAPANVKVVGWIPQQDILGHPKTRLFFTHCGMHGILEALVHGVPMVGMPVFADQHDVLMRLQERGVAKGVSKTATEEEITQALREVLGDPRYRTNAQHMSGILRSEPHTPLSRAVWLLEHVIATRGAEHLKMPGRTLNLAQYFGLDVLALLAALLLGPLWLLCRTDNFATRRICKSLNYIGRRKVKSKLK